MFRLVVIHKRTADGREVYVSNWRASQLSYINNFAFDKTNNKLFLQARNNKLQQQMMPRNVAQFLALNMVHNHYSNYTYVNSFICSNDKRQFLQAVRFLKHIRQDPFTMGVNSLQLPDHKFTILSFQVSEVNH